MTPPVAAPLWSPFSFRALQAKIQHVRSEPVIMNSTVVWDVMPVSLVELTDYFDEHSASIFREEV
jgi:hypothetical protein